jgi:NodT family efflux transporter outer membrane factor (OMF) lipoprotein
MPIEDAVMKPVKTFGALLRCAHFRVTPLILLAVLSLTGCAVRPASHANLLDAVQAIAPDTWSVGAPTDNVSVTAWWRGFGDPTLRDLVVDVLRNNLDIQAAVERVKQAEALTVERRSSLFPELNATARAADQRQITPPPLGYVREAGIGVAASWVPDVFGGERMAILAARAQETGRRDLLNSLRLAMASNAASAYIRLRWAQTALQIDEDNIKIRRRSLQLTEKRLAFGLSTQLDVARAQNQLDTIQARVPPMQSLIQHQLSLIAIYRGSIPERNNDVTLTDVGSIPLPMLALPAIMPSTALLRRPDVQAAYAVVAQRAAEVGGEQAQRYPQFRINLADGLLSASWLGLPTLTDNIFSAALAATSPIFNAGRITAQINASESRLTEAQLGLNQTMLSGLKEIEDTRSDLVTLSQQEDRLTDALKTSDQAVQLSTRLYTSGATSFLDVLTAQNAYLQDALALADVKRDRALETVALYRSLGGWAIGPVVDRGQMIGTADNLALAQPK